jgi:hypothetical protein
MRPLFSLEDEDHDEGFAEELLGLDVADDEDENRDASLDERDDELEKLGEENADGE